MRVEISGPCRLNLAILRLINMMNRTFETWRSDGAAVVARGVKPREEGLTSLHGSWCRYHPYSGAEVDARVFATDDSRNQVAELID